MRFPSLTTAQRDAIPVDRAHTGTVIYNTDLGRLQINVGSDSNRVWSNVETTNGTINTVLSYEKTAIQTINFLSNDVNVRVPITFEKVHFLHQKWLFQLIISPNYFLGTILLCTRHKSKGTNPCG